MVEKSLQNKNIILINLDGLRRDKVTKISQLNNIKKNSYFFDNMFTVAPYTFASLHAIFSGLYPSKNGVNAYYNIFNFKKNSIETIPQLLQKFGYFTCCDVISKSVMPEQGYDEYRIFDEKTVDFKSRHSELIKFLSSKEKFFLFLHYTEVHKHLVREIVEKYKNHNDSNYYQSIEQNDKRYESYLPHCNDYISAILNSLRESGIYDDTIIIFFSDHGTSIGEKTGEQFYGVFTYDYTIQVFCLIHNIELDKKIITNQCSTIDIYPTIIELLRIPSPKSLTLQGKSLLDLIKNSSTPERDVFVETGGLYGPWPSPRKHNVFCLRKNNFKLIYNDTPQTWEYYDLINDPGEKNNIICNSLEIESLKEQLISFFKANNITTNLTPN